MHSERNKQTQKQTTNNDISPLKLQKQSIVPFADTALREFCQTTREREGEREREREREREIS